MNYIDTLRCKLRHYKFFIGLLQFKLDNKLPLTRVEEDLLSFLDDKYEVIKKVEVYLNDYEE